MSTVRWGVDFFWTTLRKNRLTGLAIMMMNSWCVQAVSICYVCGGRWQAYWAVHLLSSLNQEQLCALI